MPTECREYFVGPSIGDAVRCEEDQLMLSFALRTRFQEGNILGYAVRVIHGPETVIDEDLDDEEVTAITGGKFPAVWCNITFDPAVVSESNWAGLVSTLGLQHYSSNYLETSFASRKHAEPGAAADGGA